MRLILVLALVLVVGCEKKTQTSEEQRAAKQVAQMAAFAQRHGAGPFPVNVGHRESLAVDIQSEIQATKNQPVALEAYLEDVVLGPDGRAIALLWPSEFRFSEPHIDLRVSVDAPSIEILRGIKGHYMGFYVVIKDLSTHIERGNDGDLKIIADGSCVVVERKPE